MFPQFGISMLSLPWLYSISRDDFAYIGVPASFHDIPHELSTKRRVDSALLFVYILTTAKPSSKIPWRDTPYLHTIFLEVPIPLPTFHCQLEIVPSSTRVIDGLLYYLIIMFKPVLALLYAGTLLCGGPLFGHPFAGTRLMGRSRFSDPAKVDVPLVINSNRGSVD